MTRLLGLTSSTYLAALVIFALTGFVVLSSLLPQESGASLAQIEAWQRTHSFAASLARPLGLFHAFSSWPFLGLLVVLSLNLAACTLSRVLSFWSKSRSLSLAGSIVLHAGLLAIVCGGAITAAYGFDGTVAVTEGQGVDLSFGSGFLRLQSGPLSSPASLPRMRLTLRRFDPVRSAGKETAFNSTIDIQPTGGEVESRRISVNRPAAVSGYGITQADYGYSPLISLSTREGRLGEAFVALKSFREGQEPRFEDFIDVPGLRSRLLMRLLPSPQGGSAGKVLSLRLLEEGGKTRRAKSIRLGEEAAVGAVRVDFRDLRYWSAYRMRRDPGMPVVYAGFLVCLIGVALRYWPAVWPRRSREDERQREITGQ